MTHYKFGLLSPIAKSGRKTLLLRYFTNLYAPDYEPTMDDYYRKKLTIGTKTVSFDLILVYGEETMASMREMTIRQADGFMLFYPVDDKAAFEGIPQLYEEIHGIMDVQRPVIIVGTKCDREADRQVSKEAGEELARRLDVLHIETSAKNNINVSECYVALLYEAEEFQKRATPREAKKKDKKDCIIC
jgi:GTPase SAR1 family protein